MTVTLSKKDLRKSGRADLLKWFETHGPDAPFGEITDRYVLKGVDKRTVYRWASDVRSEFAMATRNRAGGKPKYLGVVPTRPDKLGGEEGETRQVVEEDIIPHQPIDLIGRLNRLIGESDEAIKHSKGADGRIRNTKLHLQSVTVQAKLLSAGVDAAKLYLEVKEQREMVEIILREIELESPECQARIYQRLRRKLDTAKGLFL